MKRTLLILLMCSHHGVSVSLAAQQESMTFVELYSMARQQFLSENYESAVSHFSQIEEFFAEEEEFQEEVFQKPYRSMYGMSALLSGRNEIAVEQLENYLSTHYQKTKEEALLVMGLIWALRKQGDSGKLSQWYDLFLQDYPDHRDRYLVQFDKMVWHFELDQDGKAEAEFQRIWDSIAPSDLRYRSRLMVIQRLMDQGDLQKSSDLLLSAHWEISSMPELAFLAFNSLKVGEWLMAEGRYEEAIKAFSKVPFYSVLLEKQRSQLKTLDMGLASLQKDDPTHRSIIRESHYRTVATQMRERLKHLEVGSDYTVTFLLKYGRCFLFSGRYAEAWVIFRSLALRGELDALEKEQGWYHWILASYGAGNWDEARSLCLRFGELYPDSALLPKALFMLARTQQDAGDLARANLVLSDLMKRFPVHEDFPKWQMTRGFNFAKLGESGDALRDFEEVIDSNSVPEVILIRTRYWKAVTLSSENRFIDALQGLESLLLEHPTHWMCPDFLYRIGMIHYSMRDYERSEETLHRYLSDFPEHHFSHEAKVLLGDVSMAKGELDRAIKLFAEVLPNDPKLFMYSQFQIGKILKATEAYDELERHFKIYVDDLTFAGKARISEALYWIAWAMNQQDRPHEAIPFLLKAVRDYGNDPHSGELLEILDQLAGLKKSVSTESFANVDLEDERVLEFVTSTNFQSWIELEIERAQQISAQTYFARLQLYEALQLRRRKEYDLARAAIQNISLVDSMEVLDAQLLGEVGLALLEDEFESGERYLRRLLVRFPNTPHKALAFYGLALFKLRQDETDAAKKWLLKFEKETANHSRAADAKLLMGEVYARIGDFEEGIEAYRELLRWKQARGKPHVDALKGLARLHQLNNENDKAIAYWQRVYTLYRAYLEDVSEAYLRSAELFEKIGDFRSGLKSYDEFIGQKDLSGFSDYVTAKQKRRELVTKHPELLILEDEHGGEPLKEEDLRL
ncbi:MAG: tetratricopeptide repeat protein [Opitutales bacterium]|nr:tetratricopeptide repeat protein [Opitutales bacterium]